MEAVGARSDPSRLLAWATVGLVFAAAVLNYMDRAVLGVVMPQVRQELGLSHTGYAMAVNAFLTAYMVFYVLGGAVADRLGIVRTFCLTLLFWSMASMLHALTRGLASLCVFRLLLGVGEGGFYPTAMRGISEWFPQRERAKAVGVLFCGQSVGALLTPPVVAWITLRYGWRCAFLITGATGLALLPAWLGLHREIGGRITTPLAAADRASLWRFLRRRQYWLILASRALGDVIWFYYLFWLPGYFQEARGFGLEMVGRWLWLPYLCADAGALAGGWMSSALMRRGVGWDRSRKSVMMAAGLIALAGGGVGLVPDRFTALALAGTALFGHMAWASNILTIITEISPPRHTAVLYGITGAAGTGLAALAQPAIGHGVGCAGYAWAFLAAAVLFGISMLLLLAAGKLVRGDVEIR